MKTAEKTIVYWNRLGRTACEKHIPSRNSDTWIIEAWEAVPTDSPLSHGIDCEICKQKRSEKMVKCLREDVDFDVVARLVPVWNYETETFQNDDGKIIIQEIIDTRTYPMTIAEADYTDLIEWIFENSEQGEHFSNRKKVTAEDFDDSRDFDSFVFDVQAVRDILLNAIA